MIIPIPLVILIVVFSFRGLPYRFPNPTIRSADDASFAVIHQNPTFLEYSPCLLSLTDYHTVYPDMAPPMLDDAIPERPIVTHGMTPGCDRDQSYQKGKHWCTLCDSSPTTLSIAFPSHNPLINILFIPSQCELTLNNISHNNFQDFLLALLGF